MMKVQSSCFLIFLYLYQGAGGRSPANAPLPADMWRLSAEHRGQVLPESHRAILARGLPELRPVRLSSRRGGPSPLLQVGKKTMSTGLSEVGLMSMIICLFPYLNNL